MDLTDIFFFLSALLCLLISLGALALRLVGFSFMQGAAITTAAFLRDQEVGVVVNQLLLAADHRFALKLALEDQRPAGASSSLATSRSQVRRSQVEGKVKRGA